MAFFCAHCKKDIINLKEVVNFQIENFRYMIIVCGDECKKELVDYIRENQFKDILEYSKHPDNKLKKLFSLKETLDSNELDDLLQIDTIKST